MDEAIPMLAITTNMSDSSENEQGEEALENYGELIAQKLDSYLTVLYTLADRDDEIKTEILDLFEIIVAQSINTDCCQAVIFVWKPCATIKYYFNAVIVPVSPIEGVLLPFLYAVLRRGIIRLYLYSLLAGLRGECRMCVMMCRDFHMSCMANDVYVTFRDCRLDTQKPPGR